MNAKPIDRVRGRWPLQRFTIRTGNQKAVIEETTPWKAAVAAVKSAKFKSMGALMQIDRKGGETSFVSSVRACKAAGMWRDTR